MTTLDHHNVIQGALSDAAHWIGYARDANGEAHGMNKGKGDPAITLRMLDAALERSQTAIEKIQTAQDRLKILRNQTKTTVNADRGPNVVDLIRQHEGQ